MRFSYRVIYNRVYLGISSSREDQLRIVKALTRKYVHYDFTLRVILYMVYVILFYTIYYTGI